MAVRPMAVLIESARAFEGFPLYWLGETFEGLEVTEIIDTLCGKSWWRVATVTGAESPKSAHAPRSIRPPSGHRLDEFDEGHSWPRIPVADLSRRAVHGVPPLTCLGQGVAPLCSRLRSPLGRCQRQSQPQRQYPRRTGHRDARGDASPGWPACARIPREPSAASHGLAGH